jgi:hypothetical protein
VYKTRQAEGGRAVALHRTSCAFSLRARRRARSASSLQIVPAWWNLFTELTYVRNTRVVRT